jgi:hypothetical protein
VSRKPDNPAHLLMEKHLQELGLRYEREYLFIPSRKWRADFAVSKRYSDGVIRYSLVEIEGGIWTRGRHTRGKGYQADMEKYNMASAFGYKVFRFSTGEVLDGTAKEFLGKWL